MLQSIWIAEQQSQSVGWITECYRDYSYRRVVWIAGTPSSAFSGPGGSHERSRRPRWPGRSRVGMSSKVSKCVTAELFLLKQGVQHHRDPGMMLEMCLDIINSLNPGLQSFTCVPHVASCQDLPSSTHLSFVRRVRGKRRMPSPTSWQSVGLELELQATANISPCI